MSKVRLNNTERLQAAFEAPRFTICRPGVFGSVNSSGSGVGFPIYFYEFSNLKRTPRMFRSLSEFESFVRISGIQLWPYESDMIRNKPGEKHITCMPGTRNLRICTSYKALEAALSYAVSPMYNPKSY